MPSKPPVPEFVERLLRESNLPIRYIPDALYLLRAVIRMVLPAGVRADKYHDELLAWAEADEEGGG